MNIKKVASVCKRMGRVKAVQVGGTLYAGPAAALYAMPADLPKIRTADEMMAVLGYTLKEREKIMATLEHYDTAEAMMEATGIDVTGMRQGDLVCRREEICLNLSGLMLAVMGCEDGRGECVDLSLLAPMEEDLQDYGSFYRRQLGNGTSYYVAMKGFETVGIVLPVRVSASLPTRLLGISRMLGTGPKGEMHDAEKSDL